MDSMKMAAHAAEMGVTDARRKLLSELDDLADTIAQARRRVTQNPDDPHAINYCGIVQSGGGRVDMAAARFRAALELRSVLQEIVEGGA